MIRTSEFKWLLVALGAIAVLTPAITCVAPRVMGTFFIAFGLLGMIADCASKKRWPDFDWKLTLFTCALLGWGAVSIFWSIAPEDTTGKLGQLGAIFITLAFLKERIDHFTENDLQFLGKMLLIGAGAGAIVYYFEWFSGFFLYDYFHPDNGDVIDNKQNKAIVMLGFWAAVAFPFVASLKNKALYAVYAVLIAAIAWATFQSPSSSAIRILQILPFFIVVVTFVPWRRAVVSAMVIGAMILSFAMLPASRAVAIHTDWYSSPSLPSSIKARLEMWDQASRRILERPVLGWGLDSSPHLPNRGELLVSEDDNDPWAPPRPIAHLHPHNAPLQIWFELGLPGMALIAAMLGITGYGILRARRRVAYVFGVTMFAYMFLMTLSIWGIWQTWFIAMLCFTGLMANAGVRRLEDQA